MVLYWSIMSCHRLLFNFPACLSNYLSSLLNMYDYSYFSSFLFYLLICCFFSYAFIDASYSAKFLNIVSNTFLCYSLYCLISYLLVSCCRFNCVIYYYFYFNFSAICCNYFCCCYLYCWNYLTCCYNCALYPFAYCYFYLLYLCSLSFSAAKLTILLF